LHLARLVGTQVPVTQSPTEQLVKQSDIAGWFAHDATGNTWGRAVVAFAVAPAAAVTTGDARGAALVFAGLATVAFGSFRGVVAAAVDVGAVHLVSPPDF